MTKIVMTIEGDHAVTNLFRSMTPEIVVELRSAVHETTRAVEQGAKMRAPVSAGGRESRKAKRRPGPGELRDTIRAEFSDDLLTGYVRAGYGKLRRRLKGKAKSKRTKAARARRAAAGAQTDLGVYAMAVEYGSPRRGIPAQPFLRPALEAEKPRHQQRVAAAMVRAAAKAQAKAGSAA